MKKCFDAGIIQAFLDGELAADAQESVARHVADCGGCALLLSEAEEETAFAFAALEREFGDALVPTNRLWTKINDSIERENSKSIWQTAFANFGSLFASRSIAAFAGLIIVAGIFLAVRNSETGENKIFISQENESKREIAAPKQTNDLPDSPVAPNQPQIRIAAAKIPSSVKQLDGYRVVKTNFVKKEVRQTANQNISIAPVAPRNAAREFVSGEQTYIRTIASLEKTVNSRKDEVLKPSARFSFEKDLAIADDAIARMKTEIKENPKNAAAKHILLASYRNKVDLLNSVADKTELMASLK